MLDSRRHGSHAAAIWRAETHCHTHDTTTHLKLPLRYSTIPKFRFLGSDSELCNNQLYGPKGRQRQFTGGRYACVTKRVQQWFWRRTTSKAVFLCKRNTTTLRINGEDLRRVQPQPTTTNGRHTHMTEWVYTPTASSVEVRSFLLKKKSGSKQKPFLKKPFGSLQQQCSLFIYTFMCNI